MMKHINFFCCLFSNNNTGHSINGFFLPFASFFILLRYNDYPPLLVNSSVVYLDFEASKHSDKFDGFFQFHQGEHLEFIFVILPCS